MWIIKHKWVFFLFSVLLLAVSIFAIARYGLNFGIDFTGGSILEVEYEQARPSVAEVETALSQVNLEGTMVQPVGSQGILIRTHTLTEAEHSALVSVLPKDGAAAPLEKRFSAIGPSLGKELARKGVVAFVLAVFFTLIYIAVAFRGAGSRGVAQWKFGLVSVGKLIHDLIIVTGVFAWLGFLRGTEADALFLAAFLTVLGLSVNDVIAVFDRIRENLRRKSGLNFDELVGRSLSDTMGRSINTSLTVIFVLLAVYFLGGPTTRDFALALTVGMITATYSSIFLASPLLVSWQKWQEK